MSSLKDVKLMSYNGTNFTVTLNDGSKISLTKEEAIKGAAEACMEVSKTLYKKLNEEESK